MKVIVPSGITRLSLTLLGLLVAVVVIYSMLVRTGALAHSASAHTMPADGAFGPCPHDCPAVGGAEFDIEPVEVS